MHPVLQCLPFFDGMKTTEGSTHSHTLWGIISQWYKL